MDDLISRQAAVDALAKAMPTLTTPDGCGEFDHEIQIADEAFVDAINVIHNLPSEQRWIPCSERLPFAEYGESKIVLATCRYRKQPNEYKWIRMLYFNGGNWCYPTGETYDQTVLAWQPLPEPYKGGQDG